MKNQQNHRTFIRQQSLNHLTAIIKNWLQIASWRRYHQRDLAAAVIG
jgi:hypothetical protein